MSHEPPLLRLLGCLCVAAMVGVACSSSSTDHAAVASTTSAANASTSTAVTTTATSVTTSTTAEPKPVASGKGMVPVPAGTYTVGADQPGTESVTTRQVQLHAFFIDTYETTNIDYRHFVDAEGAVTPRGWFRGRLPDGQDTYPVVGVDWEWAQAYCISLGKRLPSDSEWEAAARGNDGRLYPWGNNAADVDLDTPGARPVGSVANNVSPFGVHDTVGSVWEWIDTPYVDVPAGSKVRRGGEYGRVRVGAAFRQVVSATNESVIAETGFRCAADVVDPNLEPGKFSSEHPRPAVSSTTTSPPATPRNVLRDDTFEDPKSGWIDQSDPKSRNPDYFIGYHAPTWYHVQASRAHVQVLSLAGLNYANIAIEAKAYIDKTADTTGQYRYGIVLRADGPMTAPPRGVGGPDRPRDFYAFVINPLVGKWQLLHADTLPFRVVAEGPLPAVTVTDSARPDAVKVVANGSDFTLLVNGAEVGHYDTHGYHLSGDVGMYAETLDEPLVHVHFDSILVTQLD